MLIQFYDPLLYRFLKSTQRDIARRAVYWIKSLFRAQLTNDDVIHSLWDIIFQSVDPLLPLWIRSVQKFVVLQWGASSDGRLFTAPRGMRTTIGNDYRKDAPHFNWYFSSLVFIFNSRDELMTNENHEKVPNFESIEIDDVEDLIQLSNFYKTNTPKEKFDDLKR